MSVANYVQVEFWESAIEWIKSTDDDPREVFKVFYGHQGFFKVIDENPILKVFSDKEEYALLERNTPRERLQTADATIDRYYRVILGIWHEMGCLNDLSDDIIIGMMDALYYVHLHRHDIGNSLYPAVQNRMVDMISREIFKKQ